MHEIFLIAFGLSEKSSAENYQFDLVNFMTNGSELLFSGFNLLGRVVLRFLCPGRSWLFASIALRRVRLGLQDNICTVLPLGRGKVLALP